MFFAILYKICFGLFMYFGHMRERKLSPIRNGYLLFNNSFLSEIFVSINAGILWIGIVSGEADEQT